ncbi:integrase family protein [Ideonella sp. A 288]|uniref:tyrosine-type recombinase/integrase n=1 Tax=Ideonella sp. A 288 TaxID=1962181 RepID=UPI000B4BC853|nr:integrase family protein [Ideonella sp. A 288]
MDAYTTDQRTPAKVVRLTEKRALAVPTPERGYIITWCPMTKGFGVRVTAAGARAWVAERRVDGKTVRRTLGKVDGRGAISADAARGLMTTVSGELQNGVDRLADKREERRERAKESNADALTLAEALKTYTADKRRGKDGLPLKERTRADYLAMIDAGGASAKGRPNAAGELFALAATPLHRITADDIRRVYVAASKRGARRGTYAMQVLRAVMNWHGVKVENSPLDKSTAGRDRIVLAQAVGKPNPIPAERLHAWWAAATTARSRVAADYFRLMLLTGARSGEIQGLTVRDVDLTGGRVLLRDTKNRKDHTILLSTHARTILAPHVEGKRATAPVFDVGDPRKTLETINEAAGTSVSPHDLRATFASVAEELCSAYSVKRMLNHTDGGDVTGAHYIGKSETQLRAAWQSVADFIVSAE